jgi:hypothetical protein
MRKNTRESEAQWWRHTVYEERQGWIVPQPGSALKTYELWNDDDATTGASRLHEALDDLLAIVPGGSPAAIPLDKILAWSNNHGPLGILLHRTIYVAFDVVESVATGDLTSTRGDPERRDEGAPVELKVRNKAWAQGRWMSIDRVVPSIEVAHSMLVGAALLRGRKPSGQLEAQSIGSAWGPFFPKLPPSKREQLQYPEPLSAEFVDTYCEPVAEWLHWVEMLIAAIHQLRDAGNARMVRTGSETLSWLAEPIAGHQILGREGQVRSQWHSPSLIASLAMFAMHSTAASQGPRTCKDPHCARWFLPINPRAEYHSDACRWRHSKELVRSRNKTKRKKTATSKRKQSTT